MYYVNLKQNGLCVRSATPDDAALIADYFVANRAHLKPWEPVRAPAFFEESGWKQRLVKLHELHRMALAFYLLIIDEESGDMLGTISFSNISRHPFHACNVGYSMDGNNQGRGVMKQALRMACEWMFKEQKLHRIMAAYIPTNTRSERVLHAIGFTPEGFAKDYLLIDGQWQDHNLTSLINQDWTE
ncbi:ribosomal protein S5-alanine N-acetyltransferase [Vibrio tapetis]|uniref:Ribosomal-protein-alanine acetyltransferase n=1 Tax=Vibrio tapetis subsp. tapetis TaxID=1671868 RepID=A0A2N8ZAB2_9VIBR|nr:ribosomal protein S5-alanine N-acetyltransferase [Vibrio tapetis]SON48813.1 Ribosomal-protein-alanine acetyltransferase [Vibrio tapetis subsp. tapetis]